MATKNDLGDHSTSADKRILVGASRYHSSLDELMARAVKDALV